MKKDRSLEAFMKLGAEFRLFKSLEPYLHVSVSDISRLKDSVPLYGARKRYDVACAQMEKLLFQTYYPEIDGEELKRVFYGDVSNTPFNTMDKEVLQLAKKRVIELFGENWEGLEDEQN